ncbi:MAG: UDP-N-acetyl glucosamine 2-epimerase, partial [Planctomycetes bacterium]|nr:UDP-N-acetyl glucosamine 2-epimerase [Planctomycetota bacterium]
MRIVTVVGARPQFVKAATVSRQIIALNDRLPSAEDRVTEIIVHTGQHYDAEMSDIFFKELQIPAPQHNLGVGSGSHAFQTARMLEGIEKVLLAERPEMVLIYGDTNSALAGALAAAKLHIPIAHVEAGLRSRNRKMAEEINRIVADHLASFLFCPVQAAVENLRQEGITQGVFFVGDVMYDSLIFNLELASVTSKVLEVLNLPPQSYYLATVHRAENTDDLTRLRAIFRALNQLDAIVVLPMHPRT